MIDANPVHIRFNKIDGFIKVDDGTRYLVLLGREKYDSIYNGIRYVVSVKSGSTYIISHNFAKLKVDLYNLLPLKKLRTFLDVTVSVNSVFNKDNNNYYYNIFSEKPSNELPK